MKLPKNYLNIIKGQKSPLEEYLETNARINSRITFKNYAGMDTNFSYRSDKWDSLRVEPFIELFSPFARILTDNLEKQFDEQFGNRFKLNKIRWAHFMERNTYQEHRNIIEEEAVYFINGQFSNENMSSLQIVSSISNDSYIYKSNNIKNLNLDEYSVIELELAELCEMAPSLQFIVDPEAKDLLKDYAITRIFISENRSGNKDVLVLSNELSKDALTYLTILQLLLNLEHLSEKQKEYVLDMSKIESKPLRSILYNQDYGSDISEFVSKYKKVLYKEDKEEPIYHNVKEVQESVKDSIDSKEKEVKESIKNSIAETNTRIASRRQRIQELYNELNRLQRELFYMENKDNKDDVSKALSNFLVNHPDIYGFRISNRGYITVLVHSYLDYFEPEFAREYFTQTGPKYRNFDIPLYSKEEKDFYWVLEQIFVERNYKVPLFGSFRLDTVDNHVKFITSGTSQEFYTTAEYYLKEVQKENFYYNPHIDHYSCSGENEDIIREALQVGNTEMAIAQGVSTLKNMNFLDVYVTERLVIDLAHLLNKDNGDFKLLEDLEGNKVSLNEILEIRNKEKNSENQEENQRDSQINLMAV